MRTSLILQSDGHNTMWDGQLETNNTVTHGVNLEYTVIQFSSVPFRSGTKKWKFGIEEIQRMLVPVTNPSQEEKDMNIFGYTTLDNNLASHRVTDSTEGII